MKANLSSVQFPIALTLLILTTKDFVAKGETWPKLSEARKWAKFHTGYDSLSQN